MKLTNEKKSFLSKDIGAKKFDGRMKSAKKLLDAISRDIYDLIFKTVHKKILSSGIPVEFFHYRSEFCVVVPFDWYQDFSNKHKRIIYSTENKTKSKTIYMACALPTPGGCLGNDGCTKDLFLAYLEAELSFEEANNLKTAYVNDLLRSLLGINTIKQLRDGYPDISTYIPDSWEKKQVKNLPAPINIIESLDTKHGIKHYSVTGE